jgi:uncharacterized membrane protein (DUF4010 family)
MPQNELLLAFTQFGLACVLGFLVGLERAMGSSEDTHTGIRDFTMFALLGAVSAFAASQYDNSWLMVAGFIGFLTIVMSGYWADLRKDKDRDVGITTEVAAIMTFFLGALVVEGATELSIALAIITVGILSQKQRVISFRSKIQLYELEAALKFLIITFIILPILPSKPLDSYLNFQVGTVTAVEQSMQQIDIEVSEGQALTLGQSLDVYDEAGEPVGSVLLTQVSPEAAQGEFQGKDIEQVSAGGEVRDQLGIPVLATMLSALNPYKIWLIVVLVSFISFIGYILIKIIGSSAGIGLTGLIGGLVSSTVTTLSFAKRSKETPAWNKNFAVAVILASSVMFPRLLLQIGIVNRELMKSMALPIIVMGVTGLLLAGYYFFRSKQTKMEVQEVSFDNPFSLQSAITFAAVFSIILVVTRLAVTYLGNAWLPVVAIVSGLTDADAIAFSLSDAQRAGIISLDWASFNLVLGALSNTYMKLFLVFTLGHRGLFRQLLVAFLVIGASGIITMFLYYDLSGIMG